MFSGLCECLAIFFVNFIVLAGPTILREDGDTGDLWVLSVSIYNCLMWLVHLKLAFFVKRVDIWVIICWVAFNFGPYYLYIWATDNVVLLDTTHFTFAYVHSTPLVMLVQLLVIGTSYLLNLGIMTFKLYYLKDPRHLARR